MVTAALRLKRSCKRRTGPSMAVDTSSTFAAARTRLSTKRIAGSFVDMTGGANESVKAAVDEPGEDDQLYRTHYARVSRLCRLLLSDPHEAEDVTQEVFLKLFRTVQ